MTEVSIKRTTTKQQQQVQRAKFGLEGKTTFEKMNVPDHRHRMSRQ